MKSKRKTSYLRVASWCFAMLMLAYMCGSPRSTDASPAPFPAEGSCEYRALYKSATAGSNDGADSRTVRLMHALWDNGEPDSYLFMQYTAQCYLDRKEYQSALNVLERLDDAMTHWEPGPDSEPAPDREDRKSLYYLRAQAYDGLLQHQQAANDIEMAHTMDPDDDDITAAYKRIAKDAYQMGLRVAHDEQTGYWDHLSVDERRVIAQHGGSRDDNKQSRPCHIQSFQARGYLSRTWWYCKSDGSYQDAYVFKNGHLVSKYHP